MSNSYEPNSQFVDKLEWQLSSEYRRLNRLKSPSNKIVLSRRVVAIALIVGVLSTGVAMIKAAEYVQDSWRKKIEIARIETDVEIKKVQLESTREIESEVKAKFSNGLIEEEQYLAVKHATKRSELDLKKSLLNLDEVKASGIIPRNELYAPIIGNRDFVSERLQLERQAIELGIELLNHHLARLQRLVDRDLIKGVELDLMQGEIASQKVKIEKIQKRLELRRRYLDAEITAKEVEINDRIALAQKNLHQAKSELDALQMQLQRLKVLEAQGMISQMEIKQVQYAINAAQAKLQLATLELEVLNKVR